MGFNLNDHVVSTTGGAAEEDDDSMSVYSNEDNNVYGGGYNYGSYQTEKCSTHTLLKAVAFAVVVMLVIMVICQLAYPSSDESEDGSFKSSHARRLASCGWIVYYLKGCGYCTKQKEALGGGYKNYIECDRQGNQLSGYTTTPPIACNSSQIEGYPFWYNTKTEDTRQGLQGVDALKKMARC
jgi:hypothetical protein